MRSPRLLNVDVRRRAMTSAAEHKHSAFTHIRVLGRVLYTTCGNWLVGLTPEENHWRKGEAWTRIGAYSWAAWHFRKFLTYSDEPRVRAYLAWCYAQLGMLESAAQHYREAWLRLRLAWVTWTVPAPSCASCGREAGSYSAKVSLLWTRWRTVSRQAGDASAAQITSCGFIPSNEPLQRTAQPAR